MLEKSGLRDGKGGGAVAAFRRLRTTDGWRLGAPGRHPVDTSLLAANHDRVEVVTVLQVSLERGIADAELLTLAK